jgi:hypothetical protein
VSTGRTAILVVNGFARAAPGAREEAERFPWIRLCLEQLERHTTSPYDVLVWDNSWLPAHLAVLQARPHVTVFSESATKRDVPHGRALDRLVRELPAEAEYVVTLDSDAFPVRGGWLENLIGRLESGAMLAGIWREEMAPAVRPYVHPSCLAVRRETLRELRVPFSRRGRVEVAQNLTSAAIAQGRRLSRLRRSNVRNVHHVLGGIYGDLVYHHGAGSRAPVFYHTLDGGLDEAARASLRDAAFEDLDGLIDFLAGDAPAEPPSPLGAELTVRRGGRPARNAQGRRTSARRGQARGG